VLSGFSVKLNAPTPRHAAHKCEKLVRDVSSQCTMNDAMSRAKGLDPGVRRDDVGFRIDRGR